MRATTTIIMLTASLSLAGCGSVTTAATTAVDTASAQPTPSATTNFPDAYVETATVEPADSPTGDIMDEVNNPLQLECQDGGVGESFTSLQDAWAYDGSLYSCTGTVNEFYGDAGDAYSAAIDYATSGSYGEEASAEQVNPAYGDLVGICAAKDAGAEGLLEQQAALPYALRVCPKAPQVKLMRAASKDEVFLDGDYVVKDQVKPGTYRTEAGVRGCYWERTTLGGDRLANDFVTFAPKGVTVTIRSSDGGFTSKECGTWTRVR